MDKDREQRLKPIRLTKTRFGRRKVYFVVEQSQENILDELITVYCQTCDNEDRDTKENLERAGWKITDQVRLCPLCNFG